MPSLKKTTDLIEIPAIVEPHQGTSYNPPVDAHHELLLKAAAIEEKRLQDAERMAEVKKKMEAAKLTQGVADITVPAGMVVQKIEDGDELDNVEESLTSSRKLPERKTKSQKNRAIRVLTEVCLVESYQNMNTHPHLTEACPSRKSGPEETLSFH